MGHFGKIFRTFREARGMSLDELSQSGVSKAQLSRFENGVSDLTVSKFISALDEMNMTIEEFIYAAHDFHRDSLNELLENLRLLTIQGDVSGMQRLLIQEQEREISCREIFHKLNIILIKIRLQDISDKLYIFSKDITLLTDYLFSVEYWGYYELLLFSNTLDILNHESLMVLSREMIRRSDFYRDIPKNRRLISSMMLNAYITCIERKKFIDAIYFEKQLNQCFFLETELYERLVFLYAKNFYQYSKYGNKRSILEMRKCIAFLKLAECDGLVKNFEKHFDKVISEISEVSDMEQ